MSECRNPARRCRRLCGPFTGCLPFPPIPGRGVPGIPGRAVTHTCQGPAGDGDAEKGLSSLAGSSLPSTGGQRAAAPGHGEGGAWGGWLEALCVGWWPPPTRSPAPTNCPSSRDVCPQIWGYSITGRGSSRHGEGSAGEGGPQGLPPPSAAPRCGFSCLPPPKAPSFLHCRP